jgi:hypothetical protein
VGSIARIPGLKSETPRRAGDAGSGSLRKTAGLSATLRSGKFCGFSSSGEPSVHDPAAVDVEGLAGHRIA